MGRKECEKLIAEKLQEIVDIYHQYNPQGAYLAMTYYKDSEHESVSVNNCYWDGGEDHVRPLDSTLWKEEEAAV